jgi:lysophospholipase L1-like esterase
MITKQILIGALGLLTARMAAAADAAAGAGGNAASARTPPRAAAADAVVKAVAEREAWRHSRQALLADDFGETAHYRRANLSLASPAPGEKRVVFIGDSIVEGWDLLTSFPSKGYVNRGIGGQTTAQLLVRFRQDVIDLRPAVVVMLVGTNDIAGNTGPIALPDIQKNFASLVDLARAHGIAVVLSSVLPVHNYTPAGELASSLRPPGQIVALNTWLKSYCHEQRLTYLDFFSAMVDGAGMLRRNLAEDGLHPNHDGYAVMEPLADQAIARALATRGRGSAQGSKAR